MGLIITFLLGIFFLAGAAFIRLAKNSEWIEHLSVSLAFGSMSALVILELLPEVIEEFAREHLLVAIISTTIGIAGLWILDHFIPDHDGHLESGNNSLASAAVDHHDKIVAQAQLHKLRCNLGCAKNMRDNYDNMIHIGIISAIAIILHNTVEGMTVYSLTLESLRQGALLSLGVGLHNIPMGMLIYASLENEKRSKRYLIIALASLSTFFGGLLMTVISPLLDEFVLGILLCITLGMILYIIFFELISDLLRRKHWLLSAIGSIIGILILIASTLMG